ncbi:MAG TPA: hypothetical protein VFK90_10495 [Anaeromyxobacter sp.]|nr:hypothetical protein [Anaeromyxobacter sp.]
MTALLAALVTAVALAAPSLGPEDGGVVARAALHALATDLVNPPGTDVLFDRASRSFQLRSYLVPSGADRYGSLIASFSLDGEALAGDLAWRVALDTGEVRSRSFQRSSTVCFTETGTGLAEPGGGACNRYPRATGPPAPITFSVADTRLAAGQLTSNGRPLGNEISATLLVREAYAAWSFGRAGFATARAGRKRVTVADGFVYDDYATGAEVALDLGAIGPPFSVTASLFQPTRDFPRTVAGLSPFLAVRADFLPSLFERAGLFVAAHRDRTGSVAELFRGALVERLVAEGSAAPAGSAELVQANHRLAAVLGQRLESDATMVWAGTSGKVTPRRGHRLAWTAGVLRGRIERVSTGTATEIPLAEDVRLDGRLASAAWDVDLGERVGAGAFLLYLSGGTFPAGQAATGTYGGFLGVDPFVTATNLFFAGGLSESFAARQSTAPGVNGRGVTAPGLSLDLDPTSELGIDLRGAWLVAPVNGPTGGRVYGTEVDAAVSWAARPWLVLAAELDVLWPGSFYAGRETVYKTIVAAELVTQ